MNRLHSKSVFVNWLCKIHNIFSQLKKQQQQPLLNDGSGPRFGFQRPSNPQGETRYIICYDIGGNILQMYVSTFCLPQNSSGNQAPFLRLFSMHCFWYRKYSFSALSTSKNFKRFAVTAREAFDVRASCTQLIWVGSVRLQDRLHRYLWHLWFQQTLPTSKFKYANSHWQKS